MQDLNVEIKRADEKNLYSIAVLTKKYFPYAGFNFDEVLRRVNDPNVVYYAAVSNNHTVGYVDFEVKEDQIKILGLAVLKELRGRGIGRMLLRKAVVFAKKKKKSVFLLVASKNSQAKKLYVSEGFEPRGVLKRKLNGQEIMLWHKKIPGFKKPLRREVA